MTTIIEDRLRALDSITLQRGAHDSNEQMCAMEAAAWIAGEAHSDHPQCVSPVLGVFVRALNDTLDDEARQALKPYVPRMIGTAGDGRDEERAWMATDWLVRVCAPAWLDLAGLKDSAEALRSLPPITRATVGKAQPTVEKARKMAVAAAKDAAAGDATWAVFRAGDVARNAVMAAAWDAAGDVVGAATGAAAWIVVNDAAWDAAEAAAKAAARNAAWDTAKAAAGAAAWVAAGDVAGAAAAEAKERGDYYSAQYDAAYEAAKAKLVSEPLKARFAPLKAELHRSVHELLDRMIDGPFGEHA